MPDCSDDRLPQLHELLLAHLAALDGADNRELQRAGHDDLRPRVVHDRAADLVAVEQDDAAARLHEAQGRAHAGRPGADDDGVEDVALSAPRARGRVVGGLPALADGVADETHAPELADDVEARARRLEVRIEQRQLDAARRGAEDELDGLHGARGETRRVADARERVEELGLPVDDAEDLLLRAREDARARADASIEIDDGVDRVGHDLAERRHVLQRRQGLRLVLAMAARQQPVEDGRDDHGPCERQQALGRAHGGEEVHRRDSITRPSRPRSRAARPSPTRRTA